MSISPPPLRNDISDDSGKATPPWILFFNQMFEGDGGEDWTPEWTSLTEAGGSATITARYYRISQRFVYFSIKIVPATSTSAVAGTTYAEGFPFTFLEDSVCFAVSGGTSATPGHIVSSNNRIFVPAWTTVTVDLWVCGFGIVT